MINRKVYRFVLLCFACMRPNSFGQDSAPSSHLYFSSSGGAADILINEVRVSSKALYTYYETLGWSGAAGGYAGLQEHPSGRNFIFSIWDNPAQRGPIRPVFTGHGTTTENFGGEGTGLKSWSFKLPWETGTWYAFASRAWPVGQNTHCGLWVRDGASGKWRQLITMDVAAPNAWFQGSLDAFIEDWSATGSTRRESHLRKPWRRKVSGTWEPLVKANYSVNLNDLATGGRSYNFRRNWDGGKRTDAGGEFFYMVSGGSATSPTTTNPATLAIPRTEVRPAYAPFAFKSIAARTIGTGLVEVAWEADSLGAPQFRYVLEVFDNAGFTGQPVTALEKARSDQGKDTVALAGKGTGPLHGRLTVVDLFDTRIQSPAFRYENGSVSLHGRNGAPSAGLRGERRVLANGVAIPLGSRAQGLSAAAGIPVR